MVAGVAGDSASGLAADAPLVIGSAASNRREIAAHVGVCGDPRLKPERLRPLAGPNGHCGALRAGEWAALVVWSLVAPDVADQAGCGDRI